MAVPDQRVTAPRNPKGGIIKKAMKKLMNDLLDPRDEGFPT
jgi:hypothetical protein